MQVTPIKTCRLRQSAKSPGGCPKRRATLRGIKTSGRTARHTAIIAEKLYQERELTVKKICEQLSVSWGEVGQRLALSGRDDTATFVGGGQARLRAAGLAPPCMERDPRHVRLAEAEAYSP